MLENIIVTNNENTKCFYDNIISEDSKRIFGSFSYDLLPKTVVVEEPKVEEPKEEVIEEIKLVSKEDEINQVIEEIKIELEKQIVELEKQIVEIEEPGLV